MRLARLYPGAFATGALLAEDEIEDIWDRIQDLLEDVDEGDIPTF